MSEPGLPWATLLCLVGSAEASFALCSAVLTFNAAAWLPRHCTSGSYSAADCTGPSLPDDLHCPHACPADERPAALIECPDESAALLATCDRWDPQYIALLDRLEEEPYK